MRGEQFKEPTKTEKRVFQRLRYAEDYRTTPYVGANGKSKERVSYIGKWYCPTNEAEAYRRIVWTARVAVAVALLATVGAMLVLPAPMSNKWYVVALACSVFPLAYAVMGAVRLSPKTTPMERIRYDRSVLRLKHSAAASLIILAVTALGTIVYWVLFGVGVIKDAAPYAIGDGIFAGCILLAAAANGMLYSKIKQISVEIRENSAYRAG